MELKIQQLSPGDLKAKPEGELGFGETFTDRMFVMEYDADQGWHDARVAKYCDFSLSPASTVFHYSQTVFEGLKAYRWKDGRIVLFRPDRNFARLNWSAKRMCMPEVDEEFMLESLKTLVDLEQDWVPSREGESLYIRPTYMGVDARIRVRASDRYLLFIILSPVGAYFQGGFDAASIYVEPEYVRAAPGGTGEIKAGGNYGASLAAGQKAAQEGYDQVLWLDAREHRYIEEVGSMNIFFLIEGRLVTPALQGSVLPGITRDSVMRLARDNGIEVEERPVSLSEILEAISASRLTEAFGTGTACVISPVGRLGYRGQDYTIGDGDVGSVTKTLYRMLTGIQYGTAEDTYGWVHQIT